MSSLGMTRAQVGRVFVYAVYDGVFSTKEERKRGKGGGSLSLKKHFASWCGYEEQFSGSWDMGHVLQLVYGDVLKENKDVKSMNKLMYRVMSDWKSGQTGCRFKELAEELNFAILTNKSHQETRWVRAELRSIQAMLRNLPAFIRIYANEEEICMRNGDLTLQKEYKAAREQLSNMQFICFSVGLLQILEI